MRHVVVVWDLQASLKGSLLDRTLLQHPCGVSTSLTVAKDLQGAQLIFDVELVKMFTHQVEKCFLLDQVIRKRIICRSS